jgi:hypothetical protein
MWVHEILCADRSWNDEQLWMMPFLKTKNTDMAGSWKLKFINCYA